jgi:hypothetical protein
MTRRSLYWLDIEHQGLGKFRRVQGSERYVVERTAHDQLKIWNEMWVRRTASDATRSDRQKHVFTRDQKKNEAPVTNANLTNHCQGSQDWTSIDPGQDPVYRMNGCKSLIPIFTNNGGDCDAQ